MEEIISHPIVGSLRLLDIAILFAAIAVLFVVAYFSGRKEQDTGDFFLGKRRVPMLVACMSFVATEVSAVSLTANPATGYSENLQYLQFFIGSAASKIFVAFLFIPIFYKYNCTSIYEFLRHRFGSKTQYSGSIFFFITRLVGSGVRLYAACAAVAIIFGGRGDGTDGSLLWALLAFTAISIAFIAFGGIKAVVWTGAYASAVFYLAGGAVIVYLVWRIGGGFPGAWQAAEAAGRLSVFNFGINLNDATTFWAGTANAFFIGLAVFGTDQEMVQRLLTVEKRKGSQRAIITTIAAALPILLIYLGIGTLLFMFYHVNPNLPVSAESKNIFPHFIANCLPMGLKGLILAAIILASIDSPLSSLSSSFITDIYRPLIRRGGSERHYLWVSRAAVGGFGLVLAVIAYACIPVKSVLWLAFQVVSVTGGSMLGVFLLGILTKRRSSWGNVVAMTASALLMLTLLLLSKFKIVPLAWSWLIVIGTFLTFGLAYLLGSAEENGANRVPRHIPACR